MQKYKVSHTLSIMIFGEWPSNSPERMMFQTRKVDAISVIFSGGEGPSLVHCTDVIGQTTFSVSFHNLPQGA